MITTEGEELMGKGPERVWKTRSRDPCLSPYFSESPFGGRGGQKAPPDNIKRRLEAL